MYLRKKEIQDKKSGKMYSYYKLVETVQTEKGARQKTILHLGKLDITEAERKLLGKLIGRRIAGKSEIIKFPKLEKIVDEAIQKYNFKVANEVAEREEKAQSNYVEIDLSSTNQNYYRSIGGEILGETYWKRLEFPSILSECGLNNKEIDLAKVIILGRLLSPGSELHTINWFRNISSLGENLSTDLSKIGNDSFYEIGDVLYANQGKIEHLIRQKTKNLFPYTDSIYLYDLTNTYFESSKPNSNLCSYGKSKEKRYDCPLVTLALVVDQNGFPLYSKIYRGNQSEPMTLERTLNQVYQESGSFFDHLDRPSIAMDRGIATKENLTYLKSNGYSYFVIERGDITKNYREEFSNITQEGKLYETSSKKKVYLKRKEGKDNTRVLVYSPGKAEKEKAIIGTNEKRFLEDVERLIQSNHKGNIKDIMKIQKRIGRLQERYGAISSLYEIIPELEVNRSDKTGKTPSVSNIRLSRKNGNQKKSEREKLTGCYVIETDKTDLSEEEIWNFYMKLSEVEAAFRSLKSDLGTRPVYHRLDSRIESHLFISVLAYSLLNSIKYSLNQKGYYRSWNTIMSNVKTHYRSTTIQKSRSGDIYYTRVTGIPEKDAKEIYELLDITIKKNRKIKKQQIHL